MDKVIKTYENDQKWYLAHGRLDGSNKRTDLLFSIAREHGIRGGELAGPKGEEISALADAAFQNWEAENEKSRLPFPVFRESILDKLRTDGAESFVSSSDIQRDVRNYVKRFWFKEALYLSAAVEAICVRLGVSFREPELALQNCKMENPFSALTGEDVENIDDSIRAFQKRNILEMDSIFV